VSYDRPRGLPPAGYEALVRDEPGPHDFDHVAAMCQRWNVEAELKEWTPASRLVGRVTSSGTLKRPGAEKAAEKRANGPRVRRIDPSEIRDREVRREYEHSSGEEALAYRLETRPAHDFLYWPTLGQVAMGTNAERWGNMGGVKFWFGAPVKHVAFRWQLDPALQEIVAHYVGGALEDFRAEVDTMRRKGWLVSSVQA
jgi:hypothetical protein